MFLENLRTPYALAIRPSDDSEVGSGKVERMVMNGWMDGWMDGKSITQVEYYLGEGALILRVT